MVHNKHERKLHDSKQQQEKVIAFVATTALWCNNLLFNKMLQKITAKFLLILFRIKRE